MATPRFGRKTAWWLLFFAYLVVASGLYASSLSHPFHYDDHHGITDNHYLRDAGNIPAFFAYPDGKTYFAPSEPQATHYRPLLLTSYVFNYMVGGSLFGFHLVQIMLHALGALMIALIGRRFGLSCRWAMLTGGLFLVLPIHTEAINYITARSSLMSGVLSLAAIYTFIRARQEVQIGWLAATAVLTALAVLTKEVAVALPLVFLLVDLIQVPPKTRRWGIHGYGLVIGMLLAGLLLVWSQGYARYLWWVIQGKEGPRGFGENLWLQAQVLVTYMRLTALPVGLSIVHDFADSARLSASAIQSALILLICTVGAVRVRQTQPLVALGWGLFILLMLPTTILPLNTPLQESRGYASIGGLVLAVMGLLAGRAPLVAAPFRKAGWGIAAVVLVLMSAGTLQRNPVWASDLALWGDAVKKAPHAFRAHSNLGSALDKQGQTEAAIASFRRAIELYPTEANVHTQLGRALFRLGRLDEAQQSLTTALNLYEPYAPAHFSMGLLKERQGDLSGAMASYNRALELVPGNKRARVNRAILKARARDYTGALTDLQTAREYAPNDPAIYVNLLRLYQHTRQPEQASRLYRQAVTAGVLNEQLTADFARWPGLPGVAGHD